MSQGEAKKEVRPIVKYRVELQKRLEINKSYKERRNRAVALRILSYGLFGQKRFQNLYLSCSLNCFYWALQIASFLHQRVAGLAMIIKFDQVHVIEYYENSTEVGKSFGEKKYTKILIKLTRSPTEEDKKQPGYNPGFKSQDIKGELTQVLGRKQGSGGQAKRENRGRGARRTGDNRRNREDRRERGDRGDRGERGERRDREERGGERRRQERTDRGDRKEYEERRNRGERAERRQKDQYRDRGYQRRQRDQQRDRPRRQQREEKRERPQRQQRERYGDDRDQRRVYRQSENQQRGERYERGERKTRGGSGGNYRALPAQNRERRYEPKREQQKNERVDREGRGDRRPKKNRYSDDSD